MLGIGRKGNRKAKVYPPDPSTGSGQAPCRGAGYCPPLWRGPDTHHFALDCSARFRYIIKVSVADAPRASGRSGYVSLAKAEAMATERGDRDGR